MGKSIYAVLGGSPFIAQILSHQASISQNSLNGMKFACEDLMKQHLNKFFAEKDKMFHENDIMKFAPEMAKDYKKRQKHNKFLYNHIVHKYYIIIDEEAYGFFLC